MPPLPILVCMTMNDTAHVCFLSRIIRKNLNALPITVQDLVDSVLNRLIFEVLFEIKVLLELFVPHLSKEFGA